MSEVRVERSEVQRMSPEREADVEQTLRQLDPLLGIRWMPLCRVDSRGRPEGRYALICRWPQVDKRWEMYRRGEIGEPFDVLGVYEGSGGEVTWHAGGGIPLDPDAVLDRTMELLSGMDNTKQSWKQRLRQSAEHNQKLRKERRDAVVEETVEEGFRPRWRGRVQELVLADVETENGNE